MKYLSVAATTAAAIGLAQTGAFETFSFGQLARRKSVDDLRVSEIRHVEGDDDEITLCTRSFRLQMMLLVILLLLLLLPREWVRRTEIYPSRKNDFARERESVLVKIQRGRSEVSWSIRWARLRRRAPNWRDARDCSDNDTISIQPFDCVESQSKSSQIASNRGCNHCIICLHDRCRQASARRGCPQNPWTF